MSLGLYTKQEAKEVNDLYENNSHAGKIFLIADWIREAQRPKVYTDSKGVFQVLPPQRRVDLNLVVHEDVEKYFRVKMGYNTSFDKTGQSAGFGLIQSIYW